MRASCYFLKALSPIEGHFSSDRFHGCDRLHGRSQGRKAEEDGDKPNHNCRKSKHLLYPPESDSVAYVYNRRIRNSHQALREQVTFTEFVAKVQQAGSVPGVRIKEVPTFRAANRSPRTSRQTALAPSLTSPRESRYFENRSKTPLANLRGTGLRHYQALAADLILVVLTSFIAVLVRDNFVVYQPHLEAITAYAVIALATSAIVFVIAAPHKALWRCTALPDVLRIVGAVTVALLLALFVSFTTSRLEGVARSVPFIHWLLLVGAMVGARIGARVWHEHARPDRLGRPEAAVERVLIVGVNHLTELYLRTLAAYGSSTIEAVGLLSNRRELRGRMMWGQEILGTTDELPEVVSPT